MTMLADIVDAVIGVDTHTDTHTACLLDHLGRPLAHGQPAMPLLTARADRWSGHRKGVSHLQQQHHCRTKVPGERPV